MIVSRWPPRRLLILAAALLFLGAGLPFLMVVKVLEATFLLAFISYGATLSGAFLGYLGILHYVRPPGRGL